jgi:hypothetical protein
MMARFRAENEKRDNRYWTEGEERRCRMCCEESERQLNICGKDVAKWERGRERNREKYWMKSEGR